MNEVEVKAVTAKGFSLAEMVDALERAGADFVRLLRSLEPHDGDKPVPALKWTVSETAVHMLTILRRGLGDRRRSDSIDGLAELNDEAIVEIPERDVHAVAGVIESELQAYAGLLRAAPPDVVASRTVKLHAGVRADVPTGLSYQLVDFLVHGWDIATATARPWTLPAPDAALAVRACLPAMRPWVTHEVLQGESRSVLVAFPGVSSALAAETGEGRYDVRPVDRTDDVAEVDAGETLLAVSGRVPSPDPHVSELASWFRPI